MSSATSTEREERRDAGFQTWHFYILLAMLAATVAVMLSVHTHPAALLLLSAAVIAAGLVGVAMHYALAGFIGQRATVRAPISNREREDLEREKALTLRSIKELEFDRAMGKVSDMDFQEISTRLRARALTLMQAIDRADVGAPAAAATAPVPAGSALSEPVAPVCAACGTSNDTDARFCKTCGAKLASHA